MKSPSGQQKKQNTRTLLSCLLSFKKKGKKVSWRCHGTQWQSIVHHSLSLSHTHIPTHTPTLYLSLSHPYTLSISLFHKHILSVRLRDSFLYPILPLTVSLRHTHSHATLLSISFSTAHFNLETNKDPCLTIVDQFYRQSPQHYSIFSNWAANFYFTKSLKILGTGFLSNFSLSFKVSFCIRLSWLTSNDKSWVTGEQNAPLFYLQRISHQCRLIGVVGPPPPTPPTLPNVFFGG